MEKKFATFDISMELKELGFDEECLCTYIVKDKKLQRNPSNNMVGEELEEPYTWRNSLIHESVITAPLWQQAIDWLFAQLDFYYPTLRLTAYSDESGEWNQSIDDAVDHVSIDFDNKEEMVLKAIELLEETLHVNSI